MIQTEPIFLGVVPRGARSYVAREIVRLDKPLFNACAGRFSIVEAVVKSGFHAAKVHASDIGLFSSLIGYLADDSKRLEDLGRITLEFLPLGRRDFARADLLPLGGLFRIESSRCHAPLLQLGRVRKLYPATNRGLNSCVRD